MTFMWIERAEFSHQMCTNLLQQATLRSDLIDAVFSGGMAFLPDPNLSCLHPLRRLLWAQTYVALGSCSSFLSIQSVLVFCSKTKTALVVMTPSPIFVIGNAA